MLASKLRAGKTESFWSDVRNEALRDKKLPQSIDRVSGDKKTSDFLKG